MHTRLRKDEPVGRILLAWWDGLEDHRADRAILRRAESVAAVTLTAAYQRLYRRLRDAGWNPEDKSWLNERLAAAVGLLVHVRHNGDRSPAKAMGLPREGSDRPAVSELRFLRLLDAPDLEALFTGLRRVLPLVDRQVDILALANDVLNWGDEVKQRWAYTYDWPAQADA